MAIHSSLHILKDSGPPEGSADYTTLIVLHGYAWQSSIFFKLLPLAQKNNTRIVLVNRRDYPGAIPYTRDELGVLVDAVGAIVPTGSDWSPVHERLSTFMRDRARELYDLVVGFVADFDVPPIRGTSGGVILAGWSFASFWMAAFLAHVASFPVNDVDLGAYVRRVIFLDAPMEIFGYPIPEDPYSPLFDTSILPSERTSVFAEWVSGYYQHGDSLDISVLDRRNVLMHPPSTLSTLTQDERASMIYPTPGDPGGSDWLLLYGCLRLGLYKTIRERALYLQATPKGETEAENGEDAVLSSPLLDVEVRNVWCDSSTWEMPWQAMCLQKEVKEARAVGRNMRNITFWRIKGANHFVHWDEPERALDALLSEPATTE